MQINEESERLQQGKTSMFQPRDKAVPPLQPSTQTKPRRMGKTRLHPQMHLPRDQQRLQMHQQTVPKARSSLPSAEAEMLSLKYYQFSLDVTAKVGYL